MKPLIKPKIKEYGLDKLKFIQVAYPDFVVELMNYGATVTEICFPDRKGQHQNVVLHYKDREKYLAERTFVGSTVGRCAGRIAGGEYRLGEKVIELEKNEGANHLHGGHRGFDCVFWSYDIYETAAYTQVKFSQTFEAEEGGYPGVLKMSVSYFIFPDQWMRIAYTGHSDQDTLLNPTNHTYFNLSGESATTVGDHFLTVRGNQIAYLNKQQQPELPLQPVAQTSFDFRKPVLLETAFMSKNQQIVQERGINHPFLLTPSKQDKVVLYHPATGGRMRLRTTAAYVVCYTGNHFNGGKSMVFHSGIALETQNLYTDVSGAANPKILLRKGQKFFSTTEWLFDCVK